MPRYSYEHAGSASECELGKGFEWAQSMKDEPLTKCPTCGKSITRQLSRISISVPKSNSYLKEKGFTKLVKRDKGVYENVTARDGDSRYMVSGKPETVPDLSKTISD